MKRLLTLGIAGAFAACVSLAAFAQGGAAGQANIARSHALMAQGSTTLAQAQMHLHHVVNCLVGPKGAGFDASAANPCKDEGNGAIPDAANDAALQARLKAALADAQAGLKAGTLAGTQQAGGKVAAALEAGKPN